MNAKVEKEINGHSVTASPIYKGGTLPAYWEGAINDRMLAKTFASATDVFRFAESMQAQKPSQ